MHQTNISQPGLITICGPATGKSGLAGELAQRLGAPILGADSRQIYQELDIGTAKPTQFERGQVPHYLIDICKPTELFTLAQYQQQAQRLIAQFQATGTVPLLVGGTGLYLRAITRGLHIPRVAPQPSLRSQLQALGQVHLYQMLQQVDPAAAIKIHRQDQVRTLRALEVFYVTGTPLSEQQRQDPPLYPILQIGLDCPDPQTLNQRIEQRIQEMLAAGWLAEVEILCDRYGPELPLLETLGYREMKQHLTGEVSLADAVALTVRHTRQFAKRQRTWFRGDAQIEWFDADHPALVEQVWARVQRFLHPT
jgi:tRNA dimethylallyltransferase